jgi:hypothetical protein
MKKCSKEKIKKCNNKIVLKDKVVTNRTIRTWRGGLVSNKPKNRGKILVKIDLKIVNFDTKKYARNAREKVFFYPNIWELARYDRRGKKSATALPGVLMNTNKFLSECRKIKVNFGKYHKTFYIKVIVEKNQWRDFNTIKLIRSGDVELNPGPALGRIDNANKMEIITYNCRGLKEYKKLKRVLNKCSQILKENKLSLIMLQETHLGINETNKLNVMWRGGYVAAPGEGASRGCLTLFDSRWRQEESYTSPDGRLACAALTMEGVEVIVLNVYAPNNHDLSFVELVFEKLIEFRDKYPLIV